MVLTIIIFIVILSLLVFVHELGHFIVAKRSGMKVDEFGFGFPPRVFGFQKRDGKLRTVFGNKSSESSSTIYSINAIPLGGFVKIVGENNTDVDNPQSFVNKPFGKRLLTLLAGVLMNVLLAWIIFSIGLAIGLPIATSDGVQLPAHARITNNRLAIVEIQPESPASKADLKPGDVIIALDEKQVTTSAEVQTYTAEHKGKQIVFTIERGGERAQKTVQALENPPEGHGIVGIVPGNLGKISYPWYLAPVYGAEATVNQLGNIITGLYTVFSSKLGLQSLGGPVKIAQITGDVANLGFMYLLQFTAFLSLNLAILNALPIPALDGGRVLFLIIEKIRGKRNNQSLEQWANTIGFVALLLLMLIVTVRDVRGL
jgi:regulator of sigma E protease